jgi:hypothetical protein
MNNLEVLPELYKDLKFIDDNGYYWIPSTVNLPNKGMVYINGTNAQIIGDGQQSPAVEIPEDEKERFPIKGKKGEYHTHKMDNSSSKNFAERDYIGSP